MDKPTITRALEYAFHRVSGKESYVYDGKLGFDGKIAALVSSYHPRSLFKINGEYFLLCEYWYDRASLAWFKLSGDSFQSVQVADLPKEPFALKFMDPSFSANWVIWTLNMLLSSPGSEAAARFFAERVNADARCIYDPVWAGNGKRADDPARNGFYVNTTPDVLERIGATKTDSFYEPLLKVLKCSESQDDPQILRFMAAALAAIRPAEGMQAWRTAIQDIKGKSGPADPRLSQLEWGLARAEEKLARRSQLPGCEGWPFDAQEAAKRQADAAKALHVPKDLTVDLTDKLRMKLTLIPAGRFLMGSSEAEDKALEHNMNCLQHVVIISKPFYIGIFPTTRAQFAAYVADSGYTTEQEKVGWKIPWLCTQYRKGTSDKPYWKSPGFSQDDDHPVVCVTHADALEFCKWLSKKSGRRVALPTEAQWEYACRAGTNTPFLWGNTLDSGEGWCNGMDQTGAKERRSQPVLKWEDGYTYTSPVGKFKANAFGLYDMVGNVREWCLDRYARYDHQRIEQTDPTGPTSGDAFVIRGASFNSGDRWEYRSAYRLGDHQAYFEFGFRVVLGVGK
jgi:formylglycine-generating enzyme required for sulfatase activity